MRVHGVEPAEARHRLHAVAGLAAQHRVGHQPTGVRGLRQEERELAAAALGRLAEVAAVAEGGQAEEGRDAVQGPGRRPRVVVAAERMILFFKEFKCSLVWGLLFAKWVFSL